MSKRSEDNSAGETSEVAAEISPPKKKSKVSDGDQNQAKPTEDEDGKVELGKNKFVDVRLFKGMVLVDIREYYQNKTSDVMKPGKKGISLHKTQWEALKANMGTISAKIEALED